MNYNPDLSKSIPELEDEVIDFWKKDGTFKKSVDKNPESNLYVFYDGPPFISGLPHYGHLLGSIAKDLIPRYWTMKGKRVERVWGWDAHGLTVENKVQKRLDIKNRRDIVNYGLEKFASECYKYTSEISSEWVWYIDKIGRWVDMDNAYKTIDQTYMESVIWVFNELYKKGMIYEGVRTSLFCTTCGTPVSNFEVAMDNSYKDVEDPAITVKFPITSEGGYKGVNILAWTTTPWTIPANRALVIDKNAQYVLVESGQEKYIVAKLRVEPVFEGFKYSILEECSGEKLLGLEYEPPFRFYASKPGEFQVYHFESMANMEEGTGIVHSAPGFGEVDTEMGRHYGLTIMLTIDDEGKFTPGDSGENPFTGMYYAKANDPIRKSLHESKLLFRDEKVVHRFPYHDRCNTLLIQKAQNSWFINVQDLKQNLLRNNENINWIPDHIKNGRFKYVIETAPDWCISRNRFWGTPMPVWESEDGERIVISSIAELEKLSGQEVKDLHRPFIDNIIIKKDGKEFKRRQEVLDSWLDAGSMPYAQVHYPFENREKFEKNFPGDYIVEYTGQVRAWFNVMHVLSTSLFNTNSFKNVIVTGVMAGSDGRKMSKTYQNYTDPKEVLENYGGDALRLYLMASPLMFGENANFDEVELKTKLRNVINPYWNSVKFFDMYASVAGWSSNKMVESDDPLDIWIKYRVNKLVQNFSQNIEAYLVSPAVREVEEFVDDLSRWYVRRSRDRISSENPAALSTLYYVLNTFTKAVAPLIPFSSEYSFQVLKKYSDEETAESVHLERYPEVDQSILNADASIVEIMSKLRDIVSLGHSVRIDEGISVRQPLEILEVNSDTLIPENVLDIAKNELNVKDITFVSEINDTYKKAEGKEIRVGLKTDISKDLKLEGISREMIRTFQSLRKKHGLSVGDKIQTAYYPKNDEIDEAVQKFGQYIKEKISAEKLEPGEDYAVFKEA